MSRREAHGDEDILAAARAERDALLADDDQHDLVQYRIDTGRQCPECHVRHGIMRVKAAGVALWSCTANPRCNAEWFDNTQPDTSTRDLFGEMANG